MALRIPSPLCALLNTTFPAAHALLSSLFSGMNDWLDSSEYALFDANPASESCGFDHYSPVLRVKVRE
ncbi:uncharacterized protein FTOL_08463 [Fusarium torulosum]|uniref:Uncharacterized protein n=1 Tax=Fusarium torulosum TaxID=33205 RepID=A0AAE8MFB2_9HYPO|nr:uncharacterized protein FTOL_08463 [Fusarium torulosum]